MDCNFLCVFIAKQRFSYCFFEKARLFKNRCVYNALFITYSNLQATTHFLVHDSTCDK